jgi:hypothetical protein
MSSVLRHSPRAAAAERGRRAGGDVAPPRRRLSLVGAITISSYVFGIVGGFVTVRHREAPREEVMGEITLEVEEGKVEGYMQCGGGRVTCSTKRVIHPTLT